MAYKKWILILALFCALPAYATTTVTGTLRNLGGGTVGQGAFVRFWLRGCSGNQPRINGTALIAPTQGGVFFFDLTASSSGVISGTIYSTRDSTGLLGGDIECGGSKTSVWYGMQTFVNGKGGPEVPIHAKNGATFDISNITPISITPVSTAPTGDSTYLRLDAGNSPVTGNATFTGTSTFTGALNCKNFESTYCLDTANTQGWSGADFTAQIASIVTAIGSAAGAIKIAPGTYTTTTNSLTIPSDICVEASGFGANGTILSWSGTPTSGGIFLAAGTKHSCLKNVQLQLPASANTSAIRIHSTDASQTSYNTFRDIFINFQGMSAGVTNVGINSTSDSAPTVPDVVLNHFDNIHMSFANQAVICGGCEGNYWNVEAAFTGKNQSVGAIVDESAAGSGSLNSFDEIWDLRVEQESVANQVCYKTGGQQNIVRLVCDSSGAGATALNDAGSKNSFTVTMVGTPTLGTIPVNSTAISAAAAVAGSSILAGSLALNGGTALATTNQSGTGNLCMTTSCVMTTPNIGAATFTSLTATNLLCSSTAPTISSGFGTSPSISGTPNGNCVFTVNVGGGGSATGGTIGMPTATTGWICDVNNMTAAAANRADNTRQTNFSNITVVLQNQTTSTGAAVAWGANDLVRLKCSAF